MKSCWDCGGSGKEPDGDAVSFISGDEKKAKQARSPLTLGYAAFPYMTVLWLPACHSHQTMLSYLSIVNAAELSHDMAWLCLF